MLRVREFSAKKDTTNTNYCLKEQPTLKSELKNLM